MIMGKETILFSSEVRMARGNAAAFLRDLADKLEAGSITLQQGSNQVTVALPTDITLELKVEEEMKRKGLKKSLEVELEWMDGELASAENEPVLLT